MNLNMILAKNHSEDLLLTITKNCQLLIEQTHTKSEKTLELKMTKPRETFQFSPAVNVKKDWMIGLPDLKVYNSTFKITKLNNKFKLYKYPDGKGVTISYEKVRDEIERDLDISDITDFDLQDDIIGPIIN